MINQFKDLAHTCAESNVEKETQKSRTPCDVTPKSWTV